MPNRQEVLDGLRMIAEEILQSLRVLFTMLFTMTKAVNPGEEVSEAEMNPLNQLVQEVRSQKMKINELGNILSQQFLKNHHAQPTSPTNSNGPKSDGWELFDMEEELYVTSGGGMKPSQAAPGPS